jgi:hypothetical protein
LTPTAALRRREVLSEPAFGYRVVPEEEAIVGSGINRALEATSLYRAAVSGLVSAAGEGTFGYIDTTMATPELNNYMSGASPHA